jgi:hypothetical protein
LFSSFRVPNFLEQCSKFVPENYCCIPCGSSVVPDVPENNRFSEIYFSRGLFFDTNLQRFKLRKSAKFLELLEQGLLIRAAKAFVCSKNDLFSGTVFQKNWNKGRLLVKLVIYKRAR